MADPYGLIGKLVAQPGQRAALVAYLLEAARLLRTAPGCRQWIVHEPLEEPDAVWVSEIWTDEAAHDASLSDPVVRGIIARSMPLLAGPPQGVRTLPRGGVGMP